RLACAVVAVTGTAIKGVLGYHINYASPCIDDERHGGMENIIYTVKIYGYGPSPLLRRHFCKKRFFKYGCAVYGYIYAAGCFRQTADCFLGLLITRCIGSPDICFASGCSNGPGHFFQRPGSTAQSENDCAFFCHLYGCLPAYAAAGPCYQDF